MKTIITLLILGSFTLAFAAERQDSSIAPNKEKEKQQFKDENQQKNKGADARIGKKGSLYDPDQFPDRGGKKRGKDVFIDKDGDGIADTRAGGMSLNKIRKRTRSGNSGSGGHGGGGYRGGS